MYGVSNRRTILFTAGPMFRIRVLPCCRFADIASCSGVKIVMLIPSARCSLRFAAGFDDLNGGFPEQSGRFKATV